MPRLHLVAAAAVILAAACASTGGVRPRYAPRSEAALVDANRPAATLITDLSVAVRAAGMAVTRESASEGYLETGWFDLQTRTSTDPPFSNLDRIVKLRFFADPVQGRTRLIAECAWRIAWDPSLPDRELERMVPPGHPGRALLDSLVAPFRVDTASTGGPPLRNDALRH